MRSLKFPILFLGLLFLFLMIPEAFSQIISDPFENDSTWFMGKGLKIGDYFSYRLCQVEYQYCKEFQMDFKIIGETQLASEIFWISEVKVEEDNQIKTGNMQMSKLTGEPTIVDVEIEEYVNAFESSVWFLGAFEPGMGKPVSLETNTNGNDREAKDIWVSIDFIGGPILIGPTKQETVLTPAGLFNSTVASWKPSGHESNIWISSFIPFPIKAKVWHYGVPEQVIEYEFELLDYGNKQENQLSPTKQISNGTLPENVICKGGLTLIFKATDNSPACVKSETAQKLLIRGWTELGNVKPTKSEEQSQKLDFTVSTWVTGFWAKSPTVFTITPEKIIISNENTGPDQPPQEIPIAKQEWQELEKLINFPNFLLLPDSIGNCPGCTDNEVQWIEISNSTISKKISFEPQENIREITDIRNKIIEILETPR